VDLGSGILASFIPGASPSFVAGDSFSFHVNQHNAISNIVAPTAGSWSWDSTNGEATIVLSGAKSFTAIALSYTLPAGLAIVTQYSLNSVDFAVLDWATGLTADGLTVFTGELVEDVTALKLSISGAGSVNWLWVGTPYQPELAAELVLRKQYDMAKSKQGGSAVKLAEGQGASVKWDMMMPDDVVGLVSLVSHIKNNGDEPLIMIPQHLHPEEAFLCRLSTDGFELSDVHHFQPNDRTQRIVTAALELTPEWK